MWQGDALDVAQILTSAAKAHLGQGAPAQGLTLCLAALHMYTRLCGPGDHPEVATALYNVARLHGTLRNFPASLAHHAAALAMQRRLSAASSGGVDEALVRCVVETARMHLALGRWLEGAALAWEAHGMAGGLGLRGPQQLENAQRLRWCRRVLLYVDTVVRSVHGDD
jgi:hypothetical protein